MKLSFTAPLTRIATLKRDTGEVDPDGHPILSEVQIELHPWPMGWSDWLDRIFPAPVVYVDQKPVEDAAARGEYAGQRAAIMLARCAPDDLFDARPPADDSKRGNWEAYGKALLAELRAAHFVDGDLLHLVGEIAKVNRGAGKLGKAG